MKGALQILFLILVLGALAQAAWQHDRLPKRVAAHFDGSGRADGWLSRGRHTALHIGTILFLTALIRGLTVLPRRLPKELVNLPHRNFWLAANRADTTWRWLSSAVLGIGCALMLFFVTLFHLIYRANQSVQPQLSAAVWIATGLLLAIVLGVAIALWKRFNRIPLH